MTALIVLVFVVIRVVGGAVLLAVLGAPRWALAAWLMLHVRLRFGPAVLALVEQAMQEIAFQAILEYGLDTSRLTTDFSIVLSGQSGTTQTEPTTARST